MAITFKEVEYTYSPDTPFAYHALKGINLNIPKGSFTALIGHTGSGKSTLIQHINGLLIPTQGEVCIDDYIITPNNKQKLKPLRKKAGLVFQFPEYQLFEETIEKDIIFGPMNFGVDEETAKKIAREMLVKVGLDESYLERSPFELSGGQKRRVAIAGILAMEPDILVLDEPTAGLDPQGTKEMMHLFKDFQQTGKSVIMVTHDMNQVLEYCDHAIVMNHGKIEKNCSVTELFNETEYLESLSIDLPIITSFIHQLNQQGFNLPVSIRSVDELIEAIGGELHE
ncbi:energy-coupling factor transporter ATPase [Sharpea azabuensis]|uniref:Energy-coupling factor transporter ATP-binding protein EcfA2 n=1 Tax=Sharpea azabuensis TaxID=322505 RepID=A0A1H6RD24_9FIRM|nr:energy-coupling factor transporter ATPase [Sharpea azabuensis]HAV18329.1 energy-coupling factor transporter ATPase [Erysipelotrichaceae bacterium]MEE3308883.1 energy-coupling factor transporter ATPase [Sharpea azabuensis]SEI53709.1 energy-coupling factor transport system ATP-binding protein [Sharpea azabuensis]SFD94001.1 energy-coupling factor transport system ATP-binding protein [Sharpea azabuensis]SFK89197.1 energy-coupling factor transport system ATP-binding protein [Sharpea azabuensis]